MKISVRRIGGLDGQNDKCKMYIQSSGGMVAENVQDAVAAVRLLSYKKML